MIMLMSMMTTMMVVVVMMMVVVMVVVMMMVMVLVVRVTPNPVLFLALVLLTLIHCTKRAFCPTEKMWSNVMLLPEYIYFLWVP